MSTRDLLDDWREAVRAAELAQRLATVAEEQLARAEQESLSAAEIARLAGQVAEAAETAAREAQAAARRAAEYAASRRHPGLTDALTTLEAARVVESAAKDRYQEAVDEAEARHRSAQDE